MSGPENQYQSVLISTDTDFPDFPETDWGLMCAHLYIDTLNLNNLWYLDYVNAHSGLATMHFLSI